MSVPGLVVLYGGVMQKRWSVNSMMLTFATFAVVLVVWVLWAFKMGFGTRGTGHGLGVSSAHSSGSRAASSSTVGSRDEANIPC
jgi:ammonia channel protein AmtB